MPRTKDKSATRAKAEVDRSVLLAIADEINTLSALLRCQPSLSEATQLVRMARDQESPSQRDRLAELAHALFGEDLEAPEEEALWLPSQTVPEALRIERSYPLTKATIGISMMAITLTGALLITGHTDQLRRFVQRRLATQKS